MEKGVYCKTEEGFPQGGPLSPLLANIYLNEFDQELKGRGVPVIRYADDIVVLAKSKRAAIRLLESCRKYFKFLGFALGKSKSGVYIRVHGQTLAKAKKRFKTLTSRSQGRNVRQVMGNVKIYIRGWIGYYYVADMKRILQSWNEWLRRRLRMYIWKQWKKWGTRV